MAFSNFLYICVWRTLCNNVYHKLTPIKPIAHESVNPSFRGYVSLANPTELEDQLFFFFVNNLTFFGVSRKQYLLTTVFLSKNLSSCILETVLAGLFVLDRLLK